MVVYNQIQQQPQQVVNPNTGTVIYAIASGGGNFALNREPGRPIVGQGGIGGRGGNGEQGGFGGGAGLISGGSAPAGGELRGGSGVALDGSVSGSAGGPDGAGFGGGGAGQRLEYISATGKVRGLTRSGDGGSGAVRLKFNGQVVDFTTPSPTNYSFRVPDGVTTMEIICIGGGASGGVAGDLVTSTANILSTRGGPGGGFSRNIVNVTPGSILEIRVGAGGRAPTIADLTASGIPEQVQGRDGEASSVAFTPPSTPPPPPPSTPPSPPTVPPPIDEDVFPCEGEFSWCWEKVNFPYDGAYTIQFEADNFAELSIGGRFISRTELQNPKAPFSVNFTRGVYDICIKLTNIPIGAKSFIENPSGVGLVIKYKRTVEGDNASWAENPLGISASLYAPPCPKESGGVGVVTSIYPVDPGNGYPAGSGNGPSYPVALVPNRFDISNPGIGYSIGDELIFDPPIDPPPVVCEIGPYGDVQRICFTPNPISPAAPRLINTTGTGANLEVIPRLDVIRDPVDIRPDRLIQVTDLVGLKQTGYINGRAYFGSVFFKDGVRYAGVYETAGELIQVYDTLQESITSQIVTPPDAIQKSGTDTRSNNPRLNIPGTPQ